MSLLVGLLTVAVVVLGVLVAGLLRSHAMILRRLHDLGAGLEEPAPVQITRAPSPSDAEAPTGRAAKDVGGEGPNGEATAIRVGSVEHDTLLAFLSSGCETCRSFWTTFADGSFSSPPGSRLVIVTKGADEESPAEVADLAPAEVPVVMSSEAWRAYEVPGSPYFVHVHGPSGTVVGEGTGMDWAQVSGLLGRSGGDGSHGRRRVRKARGDLARERDTDAALLAAGFRPGDERLFRPADEEIST